MTFKFSDQHIDDYHTRGATIFRGILPPTLIEDLRIATDKAREIAREVRGQQAQRLQPVGKFDIDLKPFEAYRDLPELHDVIERLLGPGRFYGDLSLLGVLLEPAEWPYTTGWHRDLRDNAAGFDITHWDRVLHDIELLNQVNCPLYEDSSTWIVPGSHLRHDLPREREKFHERPVRKPDLEGKSSAERERVCLEYCESMPGAERLHLNAGDFALYRASLWHLGSYVPYRKRATLHDVVSTERSAAWREREFKELAERAAAGHGVPDPYAAEPAATLVGLKSYA